MPKNNWIKRLMREVQNTTPESTMRKIIRAGEQQKRLNKKKAAI